MRISLFPTLGLLGAVLIATMTTGCLKVRNSSGSNQQTYAAGNTTAQMQKANSDPAVRISEVDDEIRNLTGRVEVVEEKISKNDSSSDSVQRNQALTINEQGQKIILLQEALGKLEAQVGGLQAELAAQRAAGTGNTPNRPAGKSKDSYELAQEAFSKKDWKQSVLNFQKYRDENPKGSHFIEATYKIGVSFQELGLKDEAKTFYDEIIAKYPKAEEAKKSKIRLKSLK